MRAPGDVRGSTLFLPGVRSPKAEGSLSALFTHSIVQCKRLLQAWVHDGPTAIQAIVYPALTVLMLHVVFGDLVTKASFGVPSIYGQTSMVALIAAMTGSMVSAVGLRAEAESGLLARFATMPVHRAAGLAGRLLAETVRIVLTTALIVAVGATIGFTFEAGPVAALGFFLVTVLFGLAFATLVTLLATVRSRVPLIEIVSILTTLLMFFNTGFAPLLAYPDWLRTAVEYQPLSCAVDAMRGLSYGGPVSEPMIRTALWAVCIIVVLAYPAVRGYRRLAESGH